jgi:hypothetical protein
LVPEPETPQAYRIGLEEGSKSSLLVIFQSLFCAVGQNLSYQALDTLVITKRWFGVKIDFPLLQI